MHERMQTHHHAVVTLCSFKWGREISSETTINHTKTCGFALLELPHYFTLSPQARGDASLVIPFKNLQQKEFLTAFNTEFTSGLINILYE